MKHLSYGDAEGLCASRPVDGNIAWQKTVSRALRQYTRQDDLSPHLYFQYLSLYTS